MAEASRILVHAIELWAQDSVFFHSDPLLDFPVLIVTLAEARILVPAVDRVGRSSWWWLPGIVSFSASSEALFSALKVT